MAEYFIVFLGIPGFFMFAAGVFFTLPKVVMEEPMELFFSLVSPRRFARTVELVHRHLSNEWPEAKVLPGLFYGGGLMLATTLIICLLSMLTEP